MLTDHSTFQSGDLIVLTKKPNADASLFSNVNSGNIDIGTSLNGVINLGSTQSSINLVGETTAKTQSAEDSSTKIATTAFVKAQGSSNTWTEPQLIQYAQEPLEHHVGYVIEQKSNFNITVKDENSLNITIASLNITPGVWIITWYMQWTMTQQNGIMFSNVSFGLNQSLTAGVQRIINPNNYYYTSGSHIITTRDAFQSQIKVFRSVENALDNPEGIFRAVRIA